MTRPVRPAASSCPIPSLAQVASAMAIGAATSATTVPARAQVDSPSAPEGTLAAVNECADQEELVAHCFRAAWPAETECIDALKAFARSCPNRKRMFVELHREQASRYVVGEEVECRELLALAEMSRVFEDVAVAVRTYDRALAECGAGLSAEERAEAQELLGDLEGEVAWLVPTLERFGGRGPAISDDAHVFLDQLRVSARGSDHRIAADPGERRLVVELKDGTVFMGQVAVGRGEVTRVTLEEDIPLAGVPCEGDGCEGAPPDPRFETSPGGKRGCGCSVPERVPSLRALALAALVALALERRRRTR